MKKNLVAFVFAVLISGVFGVFNAFAFGGRAPQVVVGSIKYYGNDPFAFPGFETVDGLVYTIKVSEKSSFTLEEIAAKQGNLLELTGKIDKSKKNGFNVLKDGIFVVEEWRVISD